MEYEAFLEPLTQLLRVLPKGKTTENHDPYPWCATVVFRDNGKTAEIKGVDKPITPAMWRACRELAKRIGVEKFTFERVCGAKAGTHEKQA